MYRLESHGSSMETIELLSETENVSTQSSNSPKSNDNFISTIIKMCSWVRTGKKNK